MLFSDTRSSVIVKRKNVTRLRRWPVKYKNCQNCGCDSERRSYGANGYCNRCNSLIKRIKERENWNRTTAKFLSQADQNRLTDKEFEHWRKIDIQQLKTQLQSLKDQEDRRQGRTLIGGYEIEMQLAFLMRHIQRGRVYNRKVTYPQYASYIESCFNSEQIRVLYELLNNVTEHIPCKISFQKSWDSVKPFQSC
jgi:hypothetical protein